MNADAAMAIDAAMMIVTTLDNAMIGVATMIAVVMKIDAAMSALHAIPVAMTNTGAPRIMDM